MLLAHAWLALVIEHTLNLGVQTRKNDTVEKSVHTAEDYGTDYYADDDLYTRVNVAFCGGVLDGGFCSDRCGTCFIGDFVCDFLDKVHVIFSLSYFRFCFY